jgi:hypothetical protein
MTKTKGIYYRQYEKFQTIMASFCAVCKLNIFLVGLLIIFLMNNIFLIKFAIISIFMNTQITRIGIIRIKSEK